MGYSRGERDMYFDDLKIGMMVDTAPAVIEKEKMMAFALDYDITITLHSIQTRNMPRQLHSAN